MKFGIFYEHQLPRPWDELSEYRLLQDSLEQIERADRLGYDASLELFAREVMPEFHARDGEHRKWKDAVLSGEIQLEEIDTSPENVPRPQRRPLEARE